MIPGSEYAPIIAIIAGHYQQPSEAIEQHFRTVEAILHGVNLKTMNGHVRRLSRSNPDDMRAIWRRAALALGATEEEALSAVLVRYDSGWTLGVIGKPGRRTAFQVVRRMGLADNIKHATAALCLALWGPK